MSTACVILEKRYASVQSPSGIAMSEAVRELFHEDIPCMTEGSWHHVLRSLRVKALLA